jgi:uncharacterized protein (TIGR03067 family)
MNKVLVPAVAFAIVAFAGCGRSQKPTDKVAVQQPTPPMAGAIVNGKSPDGQGQKPAAQERDDGFPKLPEDEEARPLSPQAQAELEKFQGTWILTKYDNGTSEPPRVPGKLTVTGDKYVFEFEASVTRGGLRLDPSYSPGHIDAVITDRQTNLPSVLPGLYEMEGDRLRSIFAQAGRPRPTNFTVLPDSSLQLFEFVREKEPGKSSEPKPDAPP